MDTHRKLLVAIDKDERTLRSVLNTLTREEVRNAIDPTNGWSAFHYACHSSNEIACALLLQYGVDPHLKNLQGSTAASLCSNDLSTIEIKKMIFEMGNDEEEFLHEGFSRPLSSRLEYDDQGLDDDEEEELERQRLSTELESYLNTPQVRRR